MSSAPPESPTPQPTSWTWPHPPLPNRYNACVTEVMDLASDGRRVAVIEGSIWPAVGSQVTVREDETQVRRGVVAKVELVLGHRAPARILVWAHLEPEPA